jgi:LDH2 family malate/lactate/ureidoglycolate dehydrogenase
VVAAIDIGMFTELEAYRADVDTTIAGIKALPRAEGCTEILAPGELEAQVHEKRAKNGIPLPAGTVRNLRAVGERFGIPLPAAM